MISQGVCSSFYRPYPHHLNNWFLLQMPIPNRPQPVNSTSQADIFLAIGGNLLSSILYPHAIGIYVRIIVNLISDIFYADSINRRSPISVYPLSTVLHSHLPFYKSICQFIGRHLRLQHTKTLLCGY